MKNLITLMLISLILITSCQPKPKAPAFDAAKAKTELTTTLDKLYSALNSKDINGVTPVLADSGLYCGTDPGEFWDKTTYVKLLTEMFSDSAYKPIFKVTKREIRFTDEKSAIVTDQFFSFWIKTVQIRHIYHFTKTGDAWLCDYSSMALIPANEDLAKMQKALN